MSEVIKTHPYRRFHFPYVTVAVLVICSLVYFAQRYSDRQIIITIAKFCQNENNWARTPKEKADLFRPDRSCAETMVRIFASHNRHRMIMLLALRQSHVSGTSLLEEYNHLARMFRILEQELPEKNLTSRLRYASGSWNIARMFTASAAHVDLSHLLVNLVHFAIFAILVEWFIGSFWLSISLVVVTVASNALYSLIYVLRETPSETLGLSGVAMGMLAMAAVLLMARKSAHIPPWLFNLIWTLVIIFISFNIYLMVPGSTESEINVTLHATGALFGVLTGLVMRRKMLVPHRDRQQED